MSSSSTITKIVNEEIINQNTENIECDDEAHEDMVEITPINGPASDSIVVNQEQDDEEETDDDDNVEDTDEEEVQQDELPDTIVEPESNSNPNKHRYELLCYRCGEKNHYRDECLTYKTRMCRFYLDGFCKRSSEECAWAHGKIELRKPQLSRCVRMLRNEHGFLQDHGCGGTHFFNECPLHICSQCQEAGHMSRNCPYIRLHHHHVHHVHHL
jgi:hypothetical protein